MEYKESNGKFYGYANIFNLKDYYNDIILPCSFKSTINNINSIKLLLQHNKNNKIGHLTTIIEDEIGLRVEGIIDVKQNYNLYNLIKNEFLTGLSIGYKVIDCYFDKFGNRIITNIDLKEISLVSNPANKLSKIVYCR